nr:MAG TPA: hypothetical protein [Caudoviricetes sp.]
MTNHTWCGKIKGVGGSHDGQFDCLPCNHRPTPVAKVTTTKT